MTRPNEAIVKIKEGFVRGRKVESCVGGTFYSFLGIPYANPPVGDLRFKAPVPVDPWEDVKDATVEGPECPSQHMFLGYYVGCEDNCLNLNIYTNELFKEESKRELKPVMVWIHGGGFVSGSNKSDIYGPDYLMMEDVVLVVINYRLGILGFLSLEDPSLDVPGNAGMKDMVLALKWVQRNIIQFFGDPNNVTIFGESAGGAAVHYLCLSPLAEGLFNKAIAQSGSALNPWAIGCSNGLQAAKCVGCKVTEEREILEHLMQMPVDKIVKGQLKSFDPFSASTIRPFGPVVEPETSRTPFLHQQPIDIIKSGEFTKVPLIMGYNSNEGLLIELLKKVRADVFELCNNLEDNISFQLDLEKDSPNLLELVRKISQFYFFQDHVAKNNLVAHRNLLLKGDTLFVHGIHRSVQLQKLKTDCPIYLYRVTLESSLNNFKKLACSKSAPATILLLFSIHKIGENIVKEWLIRLLKTLPTNEISGVSHADDLFYIFKTFLNPKLRPNSVEDVAVRRFVKLWTNFAKTGDPTPENDEECLILGNVKWDPVSETENVCLEIGNDLCDIVDPDHDRMQFWDSVYETFEKF